MAVLVVGDFSRDVVVELLRREVCGGKLGAKEQVEKAYAVGRACCDGPSGAWRVWCELLELATTCMGKRVACALGFLTVDRVVHERTHLQGRGGLLIGSVLPALDMLVSTGHARSWNGNGW